MWCNQRADTFLELLPYSHSFWNWNPHSKMSALVEHIILCSVILSITVQKKILSFRQSTLDDFRLKFRIWGKEEKREVLHLASCFYLVLVYWSVCCLSPCKRTQRWPSPSPVCIYSTSVGGLTVPVHAIFSWTPWMIPDLNNSAKLYHGEILWNVWKRKRYTCNFTVSFVW